MDGGKPYSYDGVLWRPPGVHALGVNNRLTELYRFGMGFGSIQNRTGGAIVCGIGGRVHTSHWVAGQWVQSTTTFTDDTVDAQDAGTNDFALETTTNNDGWMLASRQPVNAVCLDIGTASVGAPVRTIEYSLAGGTWQALTNVLIPPVTGANWATGEAVILWENPSDLAVLEAGHGTGVPVGMYGYRFRSTTAPGVAGVANSLSVAEIILATEGVSDNNVYEVNPGGGEYYLSNAYDAMVALLSSKAAIQSRVNIDVRVV
jgi:hypothetical protein